MSIPGVPSNDVELDFSDVFGPLPTQVSIDVSIEDPEFAGPIADVTELLYDDPVVICNRSHSLVGPSACVSHSLKLSMLTIHETVDSTGNVESISHETVKEIKELSVGDFVLQGSLKGSDDNYSRTEGVGLEDFEVMKVVGQGAFGKVFQVRKKGTSEVYAMKVMRKDKIMEKNHAEYMKAERDILTKIEHPFVVQLRYSFQVILTSTNLFYLDVQLKLLWAYIWLYIYEFDFHILELLKIYDLLLCSSYPADQI